MAAPPSVRFLDGPGTGFGASAELNRQLAGRLGALGPRLFEAGKQGAFERGRDGRGGPLRRWDRHSGNVLLAEVHHVFRLEDGLPREQEVAGCSDGIDIATGVD